MKQLLQNLKTGEGVVADVPAPVAQRGRLIVRAAASLVSAGTERAFVELGRKGLVGKAKERPDLVRKVVEKVRSEGLLNTFRAVREKLDESHALGYSAAGIVAEVGEGVKGFSVGERVACAGTGYAAHAELLSVPQNLCVRLPDGVDFEGGAFATLGAVALQGVRLAEPTLGESVVVIGLGLLGQLAAQLLKANGCRVFGVDLDASKVELAKRLGMDDGRVAGPDVKGAVLRWSRGRGADAVVITAATSSDEPIQLAGEVSRLKGRVVAVGRGGSCYYARRMLLPHFKSCGVEFVSISTATGVTARDVGERYGFARFVSGADEVMADEGVNLVVIATRHDSHAELARRALERGLDVFVEKPLALNDGELDAVLGAAAASRGRLTVGFNRRFSPHGRAA